MGWLGDEANIIVERENNRIGTESHLIQLAVSSILSQDAGKQFTEEVKRLFPAQTTSPANDIERMKDFSSGEVDPEILKMQEMIVSQERTDSG